jgi:hypothetical protein
MSWDVLLMHVPSNVDSIHELPENFSSELGPRQEIVDILTRVFPNLDFSDPTWGHLRGRGFSIEFSIGEDTVIETIMLHVRGNDDAINSIQLLCEETGWRAFDTTIGEFINFNESPAAGLQQWRAFRDQVMASLEAKGEIAQKDVRLPPAKKKKWWQFWN